MMSIPESCTVLVVGGGPAGSFAATVLAREGIDVVLLESDKHPRYHIGESMLPSMGHFLRFIDCYDAFNSHGFIKKKGAAFRLNQSQPEAYTDFIAAGGPNGHAWNVVRSEADELLFKHAAACGARAFDTTKVDAVQFEGGDGQPSNLGRPVSATWTRKDGTSGTIRFQYIVDASGRYGLLSTKYLKNRKFNQTLKNIANWGYWKGGGTYGVGTHKEGSPFFEALQDASGWCWFIPLHNGTHSIGIVQNQEMATAKKRAAGSPNTKEFFLQSLELAPRIKALLAEGELISDIKSASDWSYSASTYAFPYARIAGDAGCFIDPFFSSGVHLAVTAGVSSAVTIAASIRGDVNEETAASWHTKKTVESYTRFFLVVSSALKQIRSQENPVIQDIDEEGFQRAFDLFRPVIQGTVDADSKGKLSKSDISTTVEFCFKAFTHITPEQKEAVINKLKSLGVGQGDDDASIVKALSDVEKSLTPEEAQVLDILRSRRMIREDGLNTDSFTLDAIDGLVPNMERGKLGLKKAEAARLNKAHLFSADYLEMKPAAGFRAQNPSNGHTGSLEKPNGHDMNGTLNGTRNGSINGSTNGQATGSVNGAMSGAKNIVKESSEMETSTSPFSVGASASRLDEVGRLAVMSTFREAAENLETPFDFVTRLGNTARLLSTIRVGIQLKIFKTLAAAPAPGVLTVEELVAPTGADLTFVRRIVRLLAANRLVAEVGPGRFTANKHTRLLTDPGVEGAAIFYQGVVTPMTAHLPKSQLAENNYRSLGTNGKPVPTVFQQWAGVELFPWLKANPDMLAAFQGLMSVDRGADWVGSIPFPSAEELERDVLKTEQTPVFVDVGGNIGHQSSHVLAWHPHLAGRIVVQDRPETVASAAPTKGIAFAVHDFFTPQPILGARYYYLRSILHNWDDTRAALILAALVPALIRGWSRVLIDEIVVPDQGADVWVAGQDLNMLVALGAGERTESEWEALLDRAGLRIVEVKRYMPARGSSVIVAELK
ncbi:hypothetical protein VTI28DRAFT_9337 [Corynascus sepedonium]